MKNTIIIICLLALFSCRKDASPPPQVKQPNNQQNEPADTETLFITAEYQQPYNPTLLYWMIEDSTLIPTDTNGGYRHLYQFTSIDSLNSPISWPEDSAIGYVRCNHSWIRLSNNEPQWGLHWPDSLYFIFFQGIHGRAVAGFTWQSNSYNVRTYVKDTMFFKIFVKPHNSNL